jgi:uncharacterized OB-fold protein
MQKPIAEIFTWPSENPQLIGTRCDDCGAVTFPAQTRCARCSSPKMSELLLPRRGTIVTWTVQGFAPKPGFQGDPTGKNFQPFGVGLVQLDDVVRVEGRLSEHDPEKPSRRRSPTRAPSGRTCSTPRVARGPSRSPTR